MLATIFIVCLTQLYLNIELRKGKNNIITESALIELNPIALYLTVLPNDYDFLKVETSQIKLIMTCWKMLRATLRIHDGVIVY